jgi:hypothetical protein
VDWQQFTGSTASPTIGSSGDMWYGSTGSFVVDNSYATSTGAQANTLAAQFNAVPEPATWAMMLLGIGGIGASARMIRRKNGMALSAAV